MSLIWKHRPMSMSTTFFRSSDAVRSLILLEACSLDPIALLAFSESGELYLLLVKNISEEFIVKYDMYEREFVRDLNRRLYHSLIYDIPYICTALKYSRAPSAIKETHEVFTNLSYWENN
jgi:hypothetical protein